MGEAGPRAKSRGRVRLEMGIIRVESSAGVSV